jgi:thiosulfate dehydrogenase
VGAKNRRLCHAAGVELRRAVPIAFACLVVGAFVTAACETEPQDASAVDHGRALYDGTAPATPSKLNIYACKTCHAKTRADQGARVLTGAPLGGVTLRPRWWGGAEADLLRAVNHCRSQFLHAPQPWSADAIEARALWAFLLDLPQDVTTQSPFTIATLALDLPAGDPKRGAVVYAAACQPCHGALHTGQGRLASRISILPEEAVTNHKGYSAALMRVAFVEKVRHGSYFGFAGDMPPFAREVLSDADLAGVLAWLGLY